MATPTSIPRSGLTLSERQMLLFLGDLLCVLIAVGFSWFVWMTLDAKVDTWQRFRRALDRKVAYIPGSAFAVDGGARNALRLNFSNVPPERIPVAVERLAEALRAS